MAFALATASLLAVASCPAFAQVATQQGTTQQSDKPAGTSSSAYNSVTVLTGNSQTARPNLLPINRPPGGGIGGPPPSPPPPSPPASVRVTYFHVDHDAKTYSLVLSNGIHVKYDFKHDVATLSDAGNSYHMPLEQALLKGTKGNSSQANKLYQSLDTIVSARASSAIVATTAQSSDTSTTRAMLVQPRNGGSVQPDMIDIGFGGGLFDIPAEDTCEGFEYSCYHENGMIGGSYMAFWYGFWIPPMDPYWPPGAGPIAPPPPTPFNCGPGDAWCDAAELALETACGDLPLDEAAMGGADLLTEGACIAAGVEVGANVAADAGCLGSAAMAGVAAAHYTSEHQTCYAAAPPPEPPGW